MAVSVNFHKQRLHKLRQVITSPLFLEKFLHPVQNSLYVLHALVFVDVIYF